MPASRVVSLKETSIWGLGCMSCLNRPSRLRIVILNLGEFSYLFTDDHKGSN